MEALTQWQIRCPYCGERFDTSIDCSVEQQEYIEDCYVCCRPILFQVSVYDDNLTVTVKHENEG
ncbi:CPXCG motif-containing cysteine-rich protein [Vibrio hippocampi]|uniref:CPXCG motif-containing cysteine-rich protein n=1 Tax=Vibrio hippocampi TaxID=654686 RepID=A0ABN8DFA7_9VIBR|nr:CPXCG motif-containing cysteine-rich protein [Vibrio hippocampi]CAH0525883.1 hypothetical protein VHP8226_01382 [Vibrio hippocampi]